MFQSIFSKSPYYIYAGILHDYLYRSNCPFQLKRGHADSLFLLYMKKYGVGFFTRQMIFSSVRVGAGRVGGSAKLNSTAMKPVSKSDVWKAIWLAENKPMDKVVDFCVVYFHNIAHHPLRVALRLPWLWGITARLQEHTLPTQWVRVSLSLTLWWLKRWLLLPLTMMRYK